MKFVEFDLAKKNELIGSFSGHVQDDAVKEALETLNSKKTQLMLKLKGIRILNIKVKQINKRLGICPFFFAYFTQCLLEERR